MADEWWRIGWSEQVRSPLGAIPRRMPPHKLFGGEAEREVHTVLMISLPEQVEDVVVVRYRCEMIVVRPSGSLGELQNTHILDARVQAEAWPPIRACRNVGSLVEANAFQRGGVLLHGMHNLFVQDGPNEREIVLNDVHVLRGHAFYGLLDVARDPEMVRRLDEGDMIMNAVRAVEIVDVLPQPIQISRLLLCLRLIDGEEDRGIVRQANQLAQRLDRLADDLQGRMRRDQRCENEDARVVGCVVLRGRHVQIFQRIEVLGLVCEDGCGTDGCVRVVLGGRLELGRELHGVDHGHLRVHGKEEAHSESRDEGEVRRSSRLIRWRCFLFLTALFRHDALLPVLRCLSFVTDCGLRTTDCVS